MRTTITLEKDVAVLVERAMQKNRATLKAVVNQTLRRGFEASHAPVRTRQYRLVPWRLGGSLVGSLDNVQDVLARVEGEKRP